MLNLLLFLVTSHSSNAIEERRGRQIELSSTTTNYAEWLQVNSRAPIVHSRELFEGILWEEEIDADKNNSHKRLSREDTFFVNEQRRLIDDLFDPNYYEKNVHPKYELLSSACKDKRAQRDHHLPVRVNLSMSLYHLLEVDEHSQSIIVNVWMVQDWFDEFIDWDPRDYGMLNKTIVPHHQMWIPDTYLYNSETLEQKKTESLMNTIVTTGHWSNDSKGARVQLLYPAIYKLSCKMNVQHFPYDEQNCTFIISSWTHDKSTIDYWPKSEDVNLKNMVRNDEWEVTSFRFERIEAHYKCCKDPWVMLYAHLIIRRKPLYYIVNLVIPTSIITIVAVTGFFTPTSSSSERDEKLYLGINTLLTMSIMMLMVCNQMPSTSTYVPLMSWYYIGIIFVIVTGTLLATIVLSIHGQKHYSRPISKGVRRLIHNSFVSNFILEVPSSLIDLWTEYGIVDASRPSMVMDPLLAEQLDPLSQLPPQPSQFFRTISSEVSNSSIYSYERRLASLTKQYTMHLKRKQNERRLRLQSSSATNAREIKRKKMARRCNLEWEYLANVLDRILLTFFLTLTFFFFSLLVFFDNIRLFLSLS